MVLNTSQMDAPVSRSAVDPLRNLNLYQKSSSHRTDDQGILERTKEALTTVSNRLVEIPELVKATNIAEFRQMLLKSAPNLAA